MVQKSYNGTPNLYLISTPIGNMEDITYRAVRILSEVDYIFCEDTRVTAMLLRHHNISKPLVSSHKFNEDNNKEKITNYLKEGKNIALVSDRGTPIISDPGFLLVKHVIKEGFNVVSIPGASALLPALTSSGIDSTHFLFYGFLDSNERNRIKQLQELESSSYTIIFYESPHRIEKTLSNMLEVFGDRQISISREISKKFEEVVRGTLSEIIGEGLKIKGEFVIVVEGSKELANDLSIIDNVNVYIESGFSVMDSIKKTAKERKITKNQVYDEYHNTRGK